jgi:unsaturated chondroitin disaccharide hydrolase
MVSSGAITPRDLTPAMRRAEELAVEKTLMLDKRWSVAGSAPVFTVDGRYTARSWTQWTQGFQYGNALLCFELSGDKD